MNFNISEAQKQAFIDKIADLVVKYAKKYGYHVASAIIAQSIHETGYGMDGLSPYNNFFGLKCGGSWKGKGVKKGTWEVYDGQKYNTNAWFRVYDSVEEGVEGYFKFLNWSNYRNLKDAYDAKTYMDLIFKDHYATDPKYVSKVMYYVELHNLTKYDWKEKKPVKKPLIIFGMRGEEVAEMQRALISKGYSCGSKGADGIYGNDTRQALGAYQADHKECGSVDYKCGPKTWASLLG